MDKKSFIWSIILIIFGMLDLAKAVMANDDKEMKEAQKKLIKRIVYALFCSIKK